MTTDFKTFLEELLHEKHNLIPTAGTQAAICSIVEVAELKQNLQQTDVSGWVAVEDSLPDTLETVWISNGKGWTTLGCRSDLFDDGEGGFAWCWAAVVGGIIYEEDGSIVAECEEDDYDVRFWHRLPKPPCR